jgi:hypothetical protein
LAAIHVNFTVFAAGAVALIAATAPGNPAGLTPSEIAAFEDPIPFSATTLNVYVVPLARPLTVQAVVSLSVSQVAPPGVAVTRYPVIAEPFDEVEAVHVMSATLSPATATTLEGALGAAAYNSEFEVAPVDELTTLVDVTVNV